MLGLNRIYDGIVIRLLPVFFLVFGIMKFKLTLGIFKDYKSTIFIIFILIICFSILRSNEPNQSYLYIINKFLIFILFTTLAYEAIRFSIENYYQSFYLLFKNLYFLIFAPIFLFLVFNLFSWLLGVRGTSDDIYANSYSVIATYLGLEVPRVQFPFVGGVNSFGVYLGAILTICLVLYKDSSTFGLRIFNNLLIVLCVIMLVLTDSRSGFVYPFLISVFIFFLNKVSNIKFIRILPIISLLGPFILSALMLFLSNYSVLNDFARSDTDISTLNHRTYIWSFSLLEFTGDFKIESFIGYGQFGHFESGKSELWSNYFSGDSSEIVHPHNSIYSILFDYGYLGLLIYLVVIYYILNFIITYWRTSFHCLCKMLLAYFVFTLLIGVSESFFGFYYFNAIYMWVFMTLLPFVFSSFSIKYMSYNVNY